MICFALCDSKTGNIIGCSIEKNDVTMFTEKNKYPFLYDPHPRGAFYTIIPEEYIKDMESAQIVRENLKVLPVKPLSEDRDVYELVECIVEVRETPLDLKTAFLSLDN